MSRMICQFTLEKASISLFCIGCIDNLFLLILPNTTFAVRWMCWQAAFIRITWIIITWQMLIPVNLKTNMPVGPNDLVSAHAQSGTPNWLIITGEPRVCSQDEWFPKDTKDHKNYERHHLHGAQHRSSRCRWLEDQGIRHKGQRSGNLCPHFVFCCQAFFGTMNWCFFVVLILMYFHTIPEKW